MASSPLLEVLRVSPGDPSRVRDALEQVDGKRLVEESIRHGLVGYVAHLASTTGASLRGETRDELEAQARGVAASVLRTQRTLGVALDALAKIDVVPVVLKGLPLGARLYPSPLLRTSRDVDLLVAREDIERAALALEHAGFEQQGPPERHHLALRLGTELLELHFDALEGFGTRLDAAPLLAHARTVRYEGRELRTLAPADEAVYLAVHAVNHLLQRLSWLLDLKLLWTVVPPPVEAVVLAAERLPLGHYAYFAYEAAARLLEAPIPPSLLRELRPSPVAPVLARTLFAGGTLATAAYSEHRWAWYGAKGLLLGDPVALARWVRARRR